MREHNSVKGRAMARARTIKPGIMTNEDLGELGKDAYILFVGLWMLADREGRLEDRPRRIKMEAMPLWDDVSTADVENLLTRLAACGFISRYNCDGVNYIAIVKWYEHQHPHPREAPSKNPAPPLEMSVRSHIETRNLNGINKAMPRHGLGNEKDMPSRAGSSGSSGSSGSCGGGRLSTGSNSGEKPSAETPPPLTENAKTKNADVGGERKPAAIARSAAESPPLEKSLGQEAGASLQRMHEKHPYPSNPLEAAHQFQKIVKTAMSPSAVIASSEEHHSAWCEHWARKTGEDGRAPWIPTLAQFFTDGYYAKVPPSRDSPQPAKQPVSRQQAVRDEAKRIWEQKQQAKQERRC